MLYVFIFCLVSFLQKQAVATQAILVSRQFREVTEPISLPSGRSVVVLYASIYGDVPMVVNLSGRFYLEKGVEERLGKEFMDRINKEGYIDVVNKSGKGTLRSFICIATFLTTLIC